MNEIDMKSAQLQTEILELSDKIKFLMNEVENTRNERDGKVRRLMNIWDEE
jgi:hypothetical protein